LRRYARNLISCLLIFILSFTGINVTATYEDAYCEQTAEEKAISNTVLIDRNASSIIVSGGRRYINYDNPKEIPEIIDGSIYLPARTLSLALGCYYESLPDKNYILIRNDEMGKELYFSSGGSYEQDEMGDKKAIDFKLVYKNGNAYAPVRWIAEKLGKTVNYKDGVAIIDDKTAADALLEDSLFAYIKSLFAGFTPDTRRGNVYHVAQGESASADNPGTELEPLTLSAACSKAQAGDTVIIHKGIYREVLKPLNDGTETNPIVFKAAEGEEVVLSATEVIDNFAQEGDFAVATIPKDLGDGKNQVFYKNECLAEGRYPDNAPMGHLSDVEEPLSSLFPSQGDLKVSTENNKVVVSESLLLEDEPDYWKGATFVTVHGKAYSVATAKVESSEKGKLNLTKTSNYFWQDALEENAWNYGYLTGHINAVNLPGEWTVKDNKLYIVPPSEETAQSLSVEIKARQLTIDLGERKFVHIVGVESFGGSARLYNSEMCVLNDLDMKYISHYTYSDDQRNGYIDGYLNRVADAPPARGEVGVYIGGRDNAVIHSRFDHSAGAGIYMTGLYGYIDDNIISNCGYMGSYVSGITVYNEPWRDINAAKGGFSIYNNTVYNSGRYLFILQSIPEGVPYLPFEVAYNDFHDGSLHTMDTGNVYAYGVNAATENKVSKIHGNYVYTTSSQFNPFSFGIYCDGNSHGIDVYNNVIFATKNDVGYTHGYVWRNNKKSTCALRANSQLRNPEAGGAKGLAAEDFPKNKPFYAGSLQNIEAYTANYNKTEESVVYYSAAEGNRTGNITSTEDGGVKFADTNAKITFEDVNLSEGKKNLAFYFGADRTKYPDTLSVTLKKNLSEIVYELPLETDARGVHEMDFTDLKLDAEDGVYDIELKLAKILGDTNFYGMSVNTGGRTISESRNGEEVFATDYTRVSKIGTASDAFVKPGYEDRTGYSYLGNTFPETMLVYKNVVIDKKVNTLNLKVGTSNTTTLNIKFRIGSPTVEPVAVYSGGATGWNDRSQKQVPLTEELEAGTYDVYVEFAGSGYITSNFYSFGFSIEN